MSDTAPWGGEGRQACKESAPWGCPTRGPSSEIHRQHTWTIIINNRIDLFKCAGKCVLLGPVSSFFSPSGSRDPLFSGPDVAAGGPPRTHGAFGVGFWNLPHLRMSQGTGVFFFFFPDMYTESPIGLQLIPWGSLRPCHPAILLSSSTRSGHEERSRRVAFATFAPNAAATTAASPTARDVSMRRLGGCEPIPS